MDDEEIVAYKPEIPTMEVVWKRVKAYENLSGFLQKQHEQYSYAQLALKTGVHKSTILRIVQGSEPTLGTAMKIVESLVR